MINTRIITCLPWIKLFTHCSLTEGLSPMTRELNYIIDIVLELKTELAKIKTEVKELKKQISVIHLF